MWRILLSVLLFAVVLSSGLSAQTKSERKPKVACPQTLADCPDEGCGSLFDPNLNRRKNIVVNDQPATFRTLAWMKKLDQPENFSQGDDRAELEDLGEGQMITVVAYLIAIKPELGGESCNCGLKTPEWTDNHLVLVTKTTVDKYPIGTTVAANKNIFHERELESLTAEFTPRVRRTHPHFTLTKLKPLIDATSQKALFVRVTGQLMFDSEHYIKNHLVRVNDWEIHPILQMEYCTTGTTCKAKSAAGWKSIDDLD